MADTIRIRFEAEFGCFTRPEFSAERLSYDLPPPTAARGMVEAIFWKPEIAYHVVSVSTLRHSSGEPSRMVRLTTNEVGTLSPCDTAKERTQRRCLVLRKPAFMVEVEVLPGARPFTKAGHCLTTYREMLKRRIGAGQCIETPFLGLRDYPAYFSLAGANDEPVAEDRVLGPMTYIVWRRDNYPSRAVRDRVTQMAVMEAGTVNMREWVQ